MNVIDTTGAMQAAYASGQFDLSSWEAYLDAAAPGVKALCLDDMRECIAAGFSWEGDFLPVLNAVLQKPEQRAEAIYSFHDVTDGLDEAVRRRFGRTVDADLILYLGLCNGAGWVTPVNGRQAVLFGIEKIMELDWHGVDAMNGLVLHELGHVYHAQYGALEHAPDALPDQLLWQLFTEGIAMVFEQEIVGNPDCFHQDAGGWKAWCENNLTLIAQSFRADLPTMTHENQRWFGDWVRFEGYGDTGYYLGARFVRFLLRADRFDRVILYEIDRVRDGFDRFLQTIQANEKEQLL